MRELRARAGLIMKVLCLVLAALVVCQLAGIVKRWNPFRGAIVPELPALTAATNRPSASLHQTNLVAAATGKGTNGPPGVPSTNSSPPPAAGQTNSMAKTFVGNDVTNRNETNTNSLGATTAVAKGTNLVSRAESTSITTNLTTPTATNAAAKVVAQLEREHADLNPAPAMQATNQGINQISGSTTATNPGAAKPKRHPAGGPPPPEMAGMDFNPGQPPRDRGVDLPPAVQARIHQITESEILAPVMRPLPMALLGIAGEFAFLRSASGQTGLVKEGDSLDDLKLLRIGINRVLIEQDGQKQELMIFSGYGGDSLLPNNSTNENNHL